jgi:lipopolysaccharide transport system ATP-binding protein
MMSQPVLRVEGVGKCYRDYGSEWRRVVSWFNKGVRPRQEVWTVRDISFEIGRGEAIGIVGHNGAGKSTLLKIITGTLAPSTGQVHCQGRVAAILELGMGFHPDFTGRENVYHSAGMMGFSKEQVASVIDEVEAFAEVGDYFDQQVRTYSSGMHVRVAFAVATAFQPEILIVDEALSVGDAYFQHKSFARIREFLEKGTSLILVSHDNSAIMSLCNRALLMEKGQLLASGDPENVINVYAARTAEHEREVGVDHAAGSQVKQAVRSGNGRAVIESWRLVDADTGLSREHFMVGQKASLVVECSVHANMQAVGLGFMIRDRYGLPVYGTNSFLQGAQADQVQHGQQWVFKADIPLQLGKGNYSITIALEDAAHQRLDWIDLAIMFEVAQPGVERFIGTACLPAVMSCDVNNVQDEGQKA